MSTRAFLGEEEYDDFTDDVPLKLQSVLAFLDDVKAASVESTTEEHQHVSSNDSESEEDAQMVPVDTPNSLRLTPVFTTASVQPKQCYCLDKAHCMCNLFALPPLLTRKPSLTGAAPLAAGEQRAALSSSLPEETAAPVRTPLSTSGVAEMHLVPLHLASLHLLKPLPELALTSSTRMGTSTTCCRC